MDNLEYTIDCWALFGRADWSAESVNNFISSAHRVYELVGAKETHYGFAEHPYGTIKGAHIGSTRNVNKKVETVYAKGAALKSLEFFSLPKEWDFAYSDYGVYLGRGQDHIVLGYDTELFRSAPIEAIISEMRTQISPVWGEHFQITKGNQPLVHCMDKFKQNPRGEGLICNAYIQELQLIHIVKQFKME